MTRVFVTGATGVVGRALVPALVAAGHEVDALVRSPVGRDLVHSAGARPIHGDLLDPRGLPPIDADVAMMFAGSVPRPGGSGAWDANDRIRTDGASALLAAARAGSVRRVVAHSVYWIYGDHGDDWITEDAPLPDASELPPEIRSTATFEQIVRTGGLDWCILRSGWLYGPGTGVTERMLAAAAAGTLVTNGVGDDYVSMVTASDLARAAVMAVDRPSHGTVLNVSDDEPLRERDLMAAMAAHVGGPPPIPGPRVAGWGSLRMTNALARHTGFVPQHTDVRVGLAELFPRPSPPTPGRPVPASGWA